MFKSYQCLAGETPHEFLGNADPARLPHQFGAYVCRLHLPEVNRCRREKGLEELASFEDSYPEGGD